MPQASSAKSGPRRRPTGARITLRPEPDGDGAVENRDQPATTASIGCAPREAIAPWPTGAARDAGAVLDEELAQDRAMAALLVLAVAAHREIGIAREQRQTSNSRDAAGSPISRGSSSRTIPLRGRGSVSAWMLRTSSALGASSGSHASKKSCFAHSLFFTPRGGRRTVPSRTPSPSAGRCRAARS
jgi:hypothetical protein